jgi:hypothetical protein
MQPGRDIATIGVRAALLERTGLDDGSEDITRRTTHNYSVADFLELRAGNRLRINRDFQRLSVWKTPAKVYLIDSILRDYPIPKMYFRSTVDPKTQSSVREVVDGQQRLLAIFEFADDNLELTGQAGDLAGLRYSILDEEQQAQFLSYTFVAEQFINADDAEVLEVFARINTYTVALSPAELRHSQFQGDFKWLVHELARTWEELWEEGGVLSLAQRARMLDDGLTADMVLQVVQGITGGENKALGKAYRGFDTDFSIGPEVAEIFNDTVRAVIEHLSSVLEPPLNRPAHFVMLFAAAAHTLHGLGIGQVPWLPQLVEMPERPEPPRTRAEWERVRDRLLELGEIISLPEAPPDPDLSRFWAASRGATVNLASRRARFPFYLRAFSAG